MVIRIFLISITLCLNMSIHSQQIFTDISKYNLGKIENQTIKKTRKLLKTDKERNLSVFTFFAVDILNGFSQEHHTVDDFLNNMNLIGKYRCFVYDDSLEIIAMRINKYVFTNFNTTTDNIYMRYIIALNPEYVFEYTYSLMNCPMFFLYKDGDITVVHLSDDGKNMVSYPLSELKDWKWLNTGEKLIE